ncbi:MAG: hypothetical protein GC202_08485 [Alphaproteobacteria bacterium]|nr:hypothetical protein [Alphaproteobacteria bacterium]
MNGRILGVLAATALICCSAAALAQSPAPPQATILQRAQEVIPDKVKFAQQIGVTNRVTRDGRLFVSTWAPVAAPRGWIVVLPDARGWAQEEIAAWHPTLVRRQTGIIATQWWYGTGDGAANYATAEVVYRELAQALRTMGMKPGSVLLYGIGRGAELAFAIQAYDRHAGGRFFAATAVNSGAMAEDVAANRKVAQGQFGLGPFDDTHWMFFCGGKDSEPERAGCPTMRGAFNAVKRFGGKNDLFIEDPAGNRASFLKSAKHVDAVLDKYLSLPRP